MENNSRRSFLTKLAGGTLGLGILGGAWPYVRSLFPNVLYEPPRKFKAGFPETYQEGITFLQDRKVFIFKEGNSFHAISAICTHLGCTVKHAPFKQKKELKVRGLTFMATGEFHCPCHGSKFHEEGTNFAGPAPRPLEWYSLAISLEDGQLLVDLTEEVDRDYRLVV